MIYTNIQYLRKIIHSLHNVNSPQKDCHHSAQHIINKEGHDIDHMYKLLTRLFLTQHITVSYVAETLGQD